MDFSMDSNNKNEEISKNETDPMIEDQNESIGSGNNNITEVIENDENINDNNDNIESKQITEESVNITNSTENQIVEETKTEKDKNEDNSKEDNDKIKENKPQEIDNQQNTQFIPNPQGQPNTPWTEHKAPSGEFYYYNHITKQSTWKKPSNYIPFRPPFIPHFQQKHLMQKPIEKAISM